MDRGIGQQENGGSAPDEQGSLRSQKHCVTLPGRGSPEVGGVATEQGRYGT